MRTPRATPTFSIKSHVLLPLILAMTFALFLNPTFVAIDDASSPPPYVIPSIPHSSLLNPTQQTINTFLDAMSTCGFIRITNANLPSHPALHDAMTAFFALPHSSKMLSNFGPYGNDRGGFTPRGVESVSASQIAVPPSGKDLVESYVIRDNKSTNHHHPLLKTAALSYFSEMEETLRHLNRLTAKALRLNDEEFFNKYYWNDSDDTNGNDTNGNSLRLSHYPAVPTTATSDECEAAPSLRYGPHTDYQTFTILIQDPKDHRDGFGGLEVLVNDDWIPVVPPYDGSTTIVVNSGDLLPNWTNGRFTSNFHRVTNPTSEAGELEERYSIPFFSGPIHSTIIDPILVDEGEERLFAPVSAEKHLRRKLGLTND